MTAAPAVAPSRPVAFDAVRRRALSHTIYAGQTIPSAQMRQGEFFVTIHHGLLRALVQARSLTASQLRYLACVLEFTVPPLGYVVIRSAGGTRLPTIGDWCAWLGNMQPQQVYTLRRQLAELRLIGFVEGDPDKVTLNLHWETWHPSVFQHRAARPGAGRHRASAAHPLLEQTTSPVPASVTLPPLAAEHPAAEKETPTDFAEARGDWMAAHPAITDDVATPSSAITVAAAPGAEIQGFAQQKSSNLSAEIHRFASPPGEDAAAVTSPTLPKKEQERDLRQEETPATAGVPLRRTACPADTPLLAGVDLPDACHAESPPNEVGARRDPIHPPNSARPPRLPLPQRRDGETTRSYWLRVFGDHEAAGKCAQRDVVHTAAREVLGLALDKADLRLVGQLHHAARSWGTVLHWVLKTGDEAVADVRAYLHGFVRHAGAYAEPAPASPWLPETPAPAAGGEEDKTPAEEVPEAEEELDLATRVQRLGARIRHQSIWRMLRVDGLPAEAYQTTLEALEGLRMQGGWTLPEFVAQVRWLAPTAGMAAFSPTDRWAYLVQQVHQRTRERLGDPHATLPDIPAPGKVMVVLSDTPDPARVQQRAKALRRICGAGTDLGQAILAYVEGEEREVVEEAATILVQAQLSEVQDRLVVLQAWQEVQRLGATVQSHTRSQRHHHWVTSLRSLAKLPRHHLQDGALL